MSTDKAESGMDREGGLRPNQQQEPTPQHESPSHGVRACRGHWHVTSGGDTEDTDFDLAIPGDPFPDEASARRAADMLDAGEEVRAMSASAAYSFLAWEAALPLACPTCGHPVNATDVGIGTSNFAPASVVLAVDPASGTRADSWSTPHAVDPAVAVPLRASAQEGE